MNKNDWISLGKVHDKICNEVINWIIKNKSYPIFYEKLYNFIENRIKHHKMKMAFPVGISKNNVAAHDTALPEDNRQFVASQDYVKIDIGIHQKGYIIDSAFTWSPEFLGESIPIQNKNCIQSTKEAVKHMIKMCRPNTYIYDIAHSAEEIIQSYEDVYPIPELTGHTLERWKIHGNRLIPSSTKLKTYFENKPRIQCGDVCAIEVFTTNSTKPIFMGNLYESNHFMMKSPQKGIPHTVKDYTRQFLSTVQKDYSLKLPFTQKYVFTQYDRSMWKNIVQDCYQNQLISVYPPVYTENDCIVAQTEDTILVTPKKTISLTTKSYNDFTFQ